ncbi:MAG: hypothetical protein M0P73_08420 [Syntrophobacterales bacterium]|nr:hypothetical protein [Syntrophobacterales bacterium]
MSRKFKVLALAGCLLGLLAGAGSVSAAKTSNKISNLKFSGPVAETDRKYLGLKGGGNFTLQDIKAPYVLIEITRTT